MKKLMLLALVFSLQACAPSTMITGSWKSPTLQNKDYENIVVVALTSHTVAKATVESDMAGLLAEYGIKAAKGIDLLPPKMSNSDTDHVNIMNKVRGNGTDAIMTISLLKQETESQYVPGGYSYDPFRFDYYRNFWGYYSYWYPYSYNPGYYEESTVYYLETNLYDAKTEELVWSAQSKTYDVLNLPSFSKEFSKSIVREMSEDGILKGKPDKKK